jgi:cadmium resistance protein CadD (predicted permease)
MLTNFIEQYLPFYDQIDAFINTTLDLDGYIAQFFTFIDGLDAVTLVLGTLLAAVIFVMGTFELLKKLSKLIIVVGILVGLYLLYSNGALDSLIG